MKRTTSVYGKCVDNETRCIHWNSDLDIIAIKFACCNKYYPCYLCHIECEMNHKPKQWSKDKWNITKAILCGKCKNELIIKQYMRCGNICLHCKSKLNPGCSNHYHLYFEMDKKSKL